ncbi:MAG: hypothetical protein COZ46_05105 [Verrucomicrobia bacterium CG_4_10_14_3_um_filter_43_23]|nr:MAG: hypothetical protein AUJ82_03105 [Verrucomicrobia bacterium CG1_02_43_26]PIP58556.1 MAG: hypothetical protein COX01_08185 [Verrucomicrobia bacterium CG22_combo_CG10-13_8_21_14_all_43_17]PIX58196.1 MAG: hypothetical protein COZ46_05105 [Verrucomicrobia bacterium CG_4_10_14_3_um_filter_43_23]PIY62488.1 MAG: hypothetical protein COY94_01645 [Verrucomicrobia bacterium CG_4_10_14_0_8_um_filter_43_34]PJA44204.1 MAG: hypothetical protein CO175_04085 [Verrucomicrobia bacterium CG_4_9_14_3_um_fi
MDYFIGFIEYITTPVAWVVNSCFCIDQELTRIESAVVPASRRRSRTKSYPPLELKDTQITAREISPKDKH